VPDPVTAPDPSVRRSVRDGPAVDAADPAALPPVALYVHVPFCVSLCPYCDFVVVAGRAARGPAARVDAFAPALAVELALRADALDARFGPPGAQGRPPLETVYLGGGTPSLLPTAAIAALLDLVRARFGLAPGAEVTIEANPGPDERGEAVALARAGITRLSLGAQAMDVASLRRLGRRHTPGDVAAAVAEARAGGVGSISLDLLYDVPGQAVEAWSATLEAALALGPDHVSAYALTLDDPDAEGLTGPLGDHLPTRPGARRWRVAAMGEQDEDRAAAQYRVAVDRLAVAGFRGYEVSNWARPGHESRHNLAYWTRRPYEAVGPGAHAFDGATRRWNAARLDGYLAALAPAAGETPRLPPGGSEPVDAAAAAVEAAILGLRLDSGLALDDAHAVGSPLAPHLEWALGAGLLEPFDGAGGEPRVRLSVDGRLLSNELFSRLV
jgi:oxygen-independent coproporphyrinogen III oxidase